MQSQHKLIIGNSQVMPEIIDGSVHLMLTSPPYPMIQMWDDQFCQTDKKIGQLWQQISEPKVIEQIYDLMHENLAKVWQETYRVLVDGGMATINIGDATRRLDGKFRLFPNHSRIIEICEKIGFTTLPYILWKKPTTKPHYKGKGAFLGSGFLPPNAYVTLDCEFILIFRKGKLRKFPCYDQVRYESKFTKIQRDEWFSQIWSLTGIRQTVSEFDRRTAAYPYEIAERLIKMFSVKGDTVLDPFLGSGTTMRAANDAQRNCIGYEIEENLLSIIQKNVNKNNETAAIHIIKR
ncbi:MAG: site-specific DNA-methyltransferase [Candidatus Bathyarchaeota archaeon]|nr:site-specific DNA-methyltransferase [Candidatus Termiticorpusculum sp.]